MLDSIVPDCFQGSGNDGGEGEMQRLADIYLQHKDVLLRDVGAGLLDAGQEEAPSQDVVLTLEVTMM